MDNKEIIVLPIKAVPKGRPRFTKFGHCYTPKKTLEAEEEIKFRILSWIKKNNFKIIEDKPIAIEVQFGFSVPKSYSKIKKEQLLNKPHIVKPDCDNILKLVLDSMNGLIFKDDCLVFAVKASKIYSEEDYIKIIIYF